MLKTFVIVFAISFGISSAILTNKLDLFANNTISSTSQTNCPVFSKYTGKLSGKDVCQLSGVYTDSIILTNDKLWALESEVIIGGDNTNSATIHIQEGTQVFGQHGEDYLFISRGSKIQAIGTEENPIVFTSKKDILGLASKYHRGEWGGIVIAGNAPTNLKEQEHFEFALTGGNFGGNNPHDNSGTLNYVLIKYAGNEVGLDKELNGLSLGGVGDKTEIDYVEVYNNFDDGIELWGGTVNLKHIVLIGNGDDNIDTDHGYQGKMQYVYIKQTTTTSRNPRGLEADNLSEDFSSTPIAKPIIANFEMHGSQNSHEGILLRRGSGAMLINGYVSGFNKCFGVRDRASAKKGNIEIQSVSLQSCVDDVFAYKRATGVTLDKVESIFKQNASNTVNSITQAQDVRALTQSTFFDEAIFVGAYEPSNDWRQGWSVGLND